MRAEGNDRPNPYQSPGLPQVQETNAPKEVYEGSYKLPSSERSTIFVKRGYSNLANEAGLHSQYGPLITAQQNKRVSRDHAELVFDPQQKKLIITDRRSSYGSEVNFQDQDGEGIRNKYVFDIGEADQARDRIVTFKDGFLEGRAPQDISKAVVSNLELDFSERWAITFGPDKGLLESGCYDRVVNDGNTIYHEQGITDNGKTNVSKKILLAHNTLREQSSSDQALAENNSAAASFWSRIGLGSFSWKGKKSN
jgi:hypothetical protein